MLVAGLTAGFWLWRQHQPALVTAKESAPTEPSLSVVPNPVPINAPKMVSVMSVAGSNVTVTASKPASSSWSAVRKIVDIRVNAEQRLLAIRSLAGRKLTDLDWEILQPFLLKPDALDRASAGQVIKNELMDVLCAMNPPPASLGDDLVKIYRDQRQNDVIRDYAVQHLTAYYEQMTTQPNSDQTLQSVTAVLWEATQETGDSIGGTALLALKRLSQEYPGFDQGKIAATALQMANDNQVGELTHITAYQVCAQLGTAAVLPTLLQAAQTGETIPVRLSAIGALGMLGGPEQIPFLTSLLQDNEARLQPAVQHALEQINHRQMQVASQK